MAIKRRMADGWTFQSDTMYDKYNVFDDKEDFKIRSDWQTSATVKYVGKRQSPIVVIDDILPNIDRVRELALSTIYSNDEKKMHASPGIRCSLNINWKLNEVAEAYYSSWYLEQLGKEPDYPNLHNVFTIIDTSEPMANVQCWPHIDVAWNEGQEIGKHNTQHVAGMIFLNKPEDSPKGYEKSGTGIYRHKLLDTHLCTNHKEYEVHEKMDKKNPKRDTNINYEENDMFEVSEFVKMKYNRLVMYPTCMYHHPIYEVDDFTEKDKHCRMTLISFV